MKKYLVLLTCWLAIGCGLNSDGSKSDKVTEKYVEDRAKLVDSYAVVRGTYRGTLNDGQKEYPIELALYTLEEKAGVDSNGETVIRPVLYSRYRRLDVVVADTIMNARYIAESGELILSNPSAKSADEIQSVNAKLNGKQILGQVNQIKGVLGLLNVQLTSRDVVSAGEGDQNEINNRLRAQLQAIAGTYEGRVVPSPGVADEFPIQVQLFVVDMNSSAGVVPTLVGHYKRLDDELNVAEQNMAVVYKPETNPPQLNLQSASNNRASPYMVVMNGTLVDGVAQGRLFTQKGYVGDYEIKRK